VPVVQILWPLGVPAPSELCLLAIWPTCRITGRFTARKHSHGKKRTKATLVHRHVRIDDRPTSLALEPEFWRYGYPYFDSTSITSPLRATPPRRRDQFCILSIRSRTSRSRRHLSEGARLCKGLGGIARYAGDFETLNHQRARSQASQAWHEHLPFFSGCAPGPRATRCAHVVNN
jgi:hypothetical protein